MELAYFGTPARPEQLICTRENLMQPFRKVVVPVAGWGTRSLPASKNVPKEMLPIYNRPVIQYVMEEALRSGVTSAIFVTNRDKSVIEDYFDYNLQLEAVLQRGGKQDKLADPSGSRNGQHHVRQAKAATRPGACCPVRQGPRRQ